MSLELLKGSVCIEERVRVTIEGIFLFCWNDLGALRTGSRLRVGVVEFLWSYFGGEVP